MFVCSRTSLGIVVSLDKVHIAMRCHRFGSKGGRVLSFKRNSISNNCFVHVARFIRKSSSISLVFASSLFDMHELSLPLDMTRQDVLVYITEIFFDLISVDKNEVAFDFFCQSDVENNKNKVIVYLLQKSILGKYLSSLSPYCCRKNIKVMPDSCIICQENDEYALALNAMSNNKINLMRYYDNYYSKTRKRILARYGLALILLLCLICALVFKLHLSKYNENHLDTTSFHPSKKNKNILKFRGSIWNEKNRIAVLGEDNAIDFLVHPHEYLKKYRTKVSKINKNMIELCRDGDIYKLYIKGKA